MKKKKFKMKEEKSKKIRGRQNFKKKIKKKNVTNETKYIK